MLKSSELESIIGVLALPKTRAAIGADRCDFICGLLRWLDSQEVKTPEMMVSLSTFLGILIDQMSYFANDGNRHKRIALINKVVGMYATVTEDNDKC